MCSLEVCRKPSCKMCKKWHELHKIRGGERSYFWFTPPPTPRDRAVSNNSPPPGPKGGICPGGCLGGMVTGQIEPCIRNINVFILSLSSTCLLLRCFIFRMVLHRGKRETQVTGYMQIFIERDVWVQGRSSTVSQVQAMEKGTSEQNKPCARMKWYNQGTVYKFLQV